MAAIHSVLRFDTYRLEVFYVGEVIIFGRTFIMFGLIYADVI